MTQEKTIFHGFYVFKNLGQHMYKHNSGQMKEKLKLYCKCGVMFEAFSYDIQYGVVKYCGACKNVAKAKENIKDSFLSKDSVVRAFRWLPSEQQGSAGELQIIFTVGDKKSSTKVKSKVNTYNIKRWAEPLWQNTKNQTELPKELPVVENKIELESKELIMPTNAKNEQKEESAMREIEIKKTPPISKDTMKEPEVLSKEGPQNLPQKDSKALSVLYAKEELEVMNSLDTSNAFLQNIMDAMITQRRDMSCQKPQAHEVESFVALGREVRENLKLKAMIVRQARGM